MKDNVILIGMSGAGKSTLGVLLAKSLGKGFADTDIIIQQRDGRVLQDIIDSDGVDSFMTLEEDTVFETEFHNTVVATGGSVVYSQKAMEHLKKDATVIYLRVNFEELSARLRDITTRGIVFKGANDLRSVYLERLPLYEKYADITIDCSGKGIEQSISDIIKNF